jgi:putative ABC transport system permease protein
MDIRDILWLSYKDLNEKKIRTALTIIMVIIGVAAIVALTSVTAGISKSISSSLESLGPTSIILTSSSATGFTVSDVSTIASLKNVTSVTPILSGEANIYAGNQNTSATIIGVTPQGLLQLLGGNATLYQGSFYEEGITPQAVAGHSVAFPSSAAGTQTITVGQTATLKTSGRDGETFSIPIVGILPSHGGFIIPIDTSVFLPLAAAELILKRTSFNEMLVLASNTSSVNSTAAIITTIYGSSAKVITTSALLKTTSTIIGSISLLFTIIAGVSLLVAAIGIMNIMLIAVYERTHEIGILKSVGFKNRHIMLIFLFQALIIGFVGGLIGIGVGAGASYTLAAVLGRGGSSASAGPGASNSSSGGFGGGGGGSSSGAASSISFQPAFPISTIVYALLVAIIVSVLAGVYPAWRASKMEPIDALRQL